DKCAENGKNNERECLKDCKGTFIVKITAENKELEIPAVKGGHSGGKTGKAENFGAIKKNICEDEQVSSASKTSEANKLKTNKATVEKTEKITENTQEHVCGRKDDELANNKHDRRNETQKEFEVGYDLENCSSKEESRPTNKGSNSGRCTVLNDHSSCHTSFAKIKSDGSTFEGHQIEDKTGKVSETVPSQKANIKPEADQTSVHQKVENQKKSTERHSRPQREKDEDNIMSNISADPSRRTSSRLATLHNWHKTPPQDKERNVPRRDAKFAEKMKLKVSENANTRLRSRAVIKQPGHENRYTKGRQTRRK
ncbi:Hypothetical predicted protein, partial [Paramuricea clavata]